MFDYESLRGLEFFHAVWLEPLPASEEKLFRTAYGVRHMKNGYHIEGVVLLLADQKTREVCAIHLYKRTWF
jgi:hypothetical protein